MNEAKKLLFCNDVVFYSLAFHACQYFNYLQVVIKIRLHLFETVLNVVIGEKA